MLRNSLTKTTLCFELKLPLLTNVEPHSAAPSGTHDFKKHDHAFRGYGTRHSLAQGCSVQGQLCCTQGNEGGMELLARAFSGKAECLACGSGEAAGSSY